MMKTFVGAAETESNVAYLRPETCQPIFTDFDLIRGSARAKVPFGIAQIGKAFRNEINPRNFTARSREFSQMEMEYFCRPESADEWFARWKDYRREWYEKIGFRAENLRFREHGEKELAHYAKTATDIEYNFPFGWMEFEGIHNRTDFDLRQHQKASGKRLEYFDEETKESFTPYVIETSAGLDRIMLAVLCDAYFVDEAPTGPEAREGGRAEEERRVVMRFNPLLAPVKVAVLPLRRKLAGEARKIYQELRRFFACDYDESGSIGKRYRRQDEVGTPWGVTFDFDSLEDSKVTVRDRDTLVQERVEISQLRRFLRDKLEAYLI
jgi:glycyl-tRNA synthetase